MPFAKQDIKANERNLGSSSSSAQVENTYYNHKHHTIPIKFHLEKSDMHIESSALKRGTKS